MARPSSKTCRLCRRPVFPGDGELKPPGELRPARRAPRRSASAGDTLAAATITNEPNAIERRSPSRRRSRRSPSRTGRPRAPSPSSRSASAGSARSAVRRARQQVAARDQLVGQEPRRPDEEHDEEGDPPGAHASRIQRGSRSAPPTRAAGSDQAVHAEEHGCVARRSPCRPAARASMRGRARAGSPGRNRGRRTARRRLRAPPCSSSWSRLWTSTLRISAAVSPEKP